MNKNLEKILEARRSGERQASSGLMLKHREGDSKEVRKAREDAYNRHIYDARLFIRN
jgi:hypothetical protein